MYESRKATRGGSERATHLAFRHGPQSLNQLKPLFGPVSLFNIVQPRDGQLHHSLDGAFQLSVFLTQDIYTRVELRIVSRVVLELDNGSYKPRC